MVPAFSISSVAMTLFCIFCASANATTIELLDDHIHMATAVWFDGFSGVTSNVYDGHFFGNHVNVTSSITVEDPSDPGDFTNYTIWADADHTSIDSFVLGDMGAGYPNLGGPGGTASFDVALTYEFNVTDGNGRLEIDGYSSSISDFSLSLFDETVGAMVTDGLDPEGRGLFNLFDSHLYKLDYRISLQTHGDPDPPPYRVFNFRNVDTVTYVPEPSSLILFSAGVLGVAGIVVRKKN